MLEALTSLDSDADGLLSKEDVRTIIDNLGTGQHGMGKQKW